MTAAMAVAIMLRATTDAEIAAIQSVAFFILVSSGRNLVVAPGRTRQHAENGTRVVPSIAGIATAVA